MCSATALFLSESGRLGVSFGASGKAFDGENNDLPCHQETDKAHSDCVHEHGVEVVVNHPLDGVRTLEDTVLARTYHT